MTLDLLERRVVGNLRIPRNVTDLRMELLRSNALNAVPGYKAPTEEQLVSILESLEDDNYVVKLGEAESPTALAEAAEKNPDARTMPDEMAQIYTERLNAPRHIWRGLDDQWIMSEDARPMIRQQHAEIHEKPPMTTMDLIPVVKQMHDRITFEPMEKFEDPEGLSLVDKLLPEEFKAWYDAVIAEHERVWGKNEAEIVRRSVPPAGGTGWSDSYENSIIDCENQKTTLTAAAPWYMALAETTVPTDATTGATIDEPEYTGYARKSVAAADMNSSSAGSASNANAITFAACTSGTDTVTAFAHSDNATTAAGNLRKSADCTDVVVSTTQTPATFAAGAYTTSAD